MKLWGICEENGVGIVPFSPLSQGLLTGKYRRGQPIPEGSRATHQADKQIQPASQKKNLDKMEKLLRVAKELGVSRFWLWPGSCEAYRHQREITGPPRPPSWLATWLPAGSGFLRRLWRKLRRFWITIPCEKDRITLRKERAAIKGNPLSRRPKEAEKQ